MLVQLTMRGGIYGVQAYEPVDTDVTTDLPAEGVALLASKEMPPAPAPADAIRSERQTFELTVTDARGTRRLEYPEAAVEADPRLKALVAALMKCAKPSSPE